MRKLPDKSRMQLMYSRHEVFKTIRSIKIKRYGEDTILDERNTAKCNVKLALVKKKKVQIICFEAFRNLSMNDMAQQTKQSPGPFSVDKALPDAATPPAQVSSHLLCTNHPGRIDCHLHPTRKAENMPNLTLYRSL